MFTISNQAEFELVNKHGYSIADVEHTSNCNCQECHFRNREGMTEVEKIAEYLVLNFSGGQIMDALSKAYKSERDYHMNRYWNSGCTDGQAAKEGLDCELFATRLKGIAK